MKRRLDELELVQNNVRLMNELLSHFRPESGEDERLLLKVCEEREKNPTGNDTASVLRSTLSYFTLRQCFLSKTPPPPPPHH